MISYKVCIKSGTGGHFDPEGKDFVISGEISNSPIPRKNETIVLYDKNTQQKEYVVTDVKYTLVYSSFTCSYSMSTIVYCIPKDNKEDSQ